MYIIYKYIVAALGEIKCSDGPVMAACDTFNINVKGRGGHGGVPHQANDAIVTACSLVTSMQSIVSRNIDPLQCGVVTCGTINGGFAENVIADNVIITGTTRSYVPDVRQTIQDRLQCLCCGFAKGYGSEINLQYYRK